jgi:hypothetical protein
MKKNLVLTALLTSLLLACKDGPGPSSGVSVIRVEALNRDADVPALYPQLHFSSKYSDEYEFNDERFIRYADIPLERMAFSMDDSYEHIKSIHLDLFPVKEDVDRMKKVLTAAYGQPGEDSTHEFPSDGDIQVWKGKDRLIGLRVTKDSTQEGKMSVSPNLYISFITPEENVPNE